MGIQASESCPIRFQELHTSLEQPKAAQQPSLSVLLSLRRERMPHKW
jgi:hypothetical protein